jgi:hypothetical protein
MTWFNKIGTNYGWEISLFNKMLSHKHLTFVSFDCEWGWGKEYDHHPQFRIILEILNWVLFEFDIYYLHHRDDESEVPTIKDDLRLVKEPDGTWKWEYTKD